MNAEFLKCNHSLTINPESAAVKLIKTGKIVGIAKFWAGNMYGTNTGKLFFELEDTGPNISGTLRIMDAEHGIAEYSIKGYFNEKLTLTGDPVKGPPDVELGTLTAKAVLTLEGNLRGTWRTSIGTGGAFTGFPHHGAYQENVAQALPPIAKQLYTKNISLGSVRLFNNDVKRLIAYIREDFDSTQPVVTYNVRGSQVTKFAEDFLNEANSLGQLNYLKITTQEPEPGGYHINRLIVVELNAIGSNEVRGQSIQESWVIGKTEATAALLKQNESVSITSYKKFGLGLNHIAFLTMLIFIPEISGWKDRALFVSVVFVLLTLMLWLHAHFIPNASIQMRVKNPSFWDKISSTFESLAIGIGASLIAAYMYTKLT